MENSVKTLKDTDRKRFWELDFLRGFCVILMLIDHFMNALFSVLPSVWTFCGKFWVGAEHFAKLYWQFPAREWAHYVVVALFMLLCGISCTLSRSNLKRGAIAAGAALLISAVTFIFDDLMGIGIVFGVIHMLAASMLLYWLLDLIGKQIKKIGNKCLPKFFDWLGRLFPAIVGAVLLTVYFTCLGGFQIDGDGGLQLLSKVSFDGLPAKGFWSVFVEAMDYDLRTADYFPMLPYSAIVLIGSAIGELCYRGRTQNALSRLDGKWNKPVCFVGRHAMIFYLLHQVVNALFLFAAGVVFKTFFAG